MCEINLENLCRLCLKESFLHANIFVDRAPHSSLIYEVLNYVYDLEISIEDGLSANICQPCFWKLREFEIYKINVHQAKSELWNLKCKDTENLIKGEVEEIVIRVQENENTDEIEREGYESSPDVPEEGMMTVKEENDASTSEVISEIIPAEEDNGNCAESYREWYSETYDEDSHINSTAIEINSAEKEHEERCIGKDIPTEETIAQDTKRILHPRLLDDYSLKISELKGKYQSNKGDKVPERKTSWKLMHNKSESSDEEINLLKDCERSGENEGSKKHVRDKLRQDLLEFKRLHTVCGVYPCEYCDENFVRNRDLQKHLISHGVYAKYICEHCRKEFTKRCRLKQHIRCHVRPYGCKICQKRFSYKNHLERHMNVHTGVSSWKCSICKKMFGRKDHMKRHMKIHSSDKPFSCKLCDFKTVYESYIKDHQRIHTSEKYDCPFCSRSYKSYNAILKHKKLMHAKEWRKLNPQVN